MVTSMGIGRQQPGHQSVSSGGTGSGATSPAGTAGSGMGIPLIPNASQRALRRSSSVILERSMGSSMMEKAWSADPQGVLRFAAPSGGGAFRVHQSASCMRCCSPNIYSMGCLVGLGPTTTGFTGQRSSHLSYRHHIPLLVLPRQALHDSNVQPLLLESNALPVELRACLSASGEPGLRPCAQSHHR